MIINISGNPNIAIQNRIMNGTKENLPGKSALPSVFKHASAAARRLAFESVLRRQAGRQGENKPDTAG
jgi:hypothetical protein